MFGANAPKHFLNYRKYETYVKSNVNQQNLYFVCKSDENIFLTNHQNLIEAN